jgi:hypothetical protein
VASFGARCDDVLGMEKRSYWWGWTWRGVVMLTGTLYRSEPGRGGGLARETAGSSGLLYFTGFGERRRGGGGVMEAVPTWERRGGGRWAARRRCEAAENDSDAQLGDSGLAFSRKREKREWPSWAERLGGPEWCRFGLAGRPRPREGEGGPRGGEGRQAKRGWRSKGGEGAGRPRGEGGQTPAGLG